MLNNNSIIYLLTNNDENFTPNSISSLPVVSDYLKLNVEYYEPQHILNMHLEEEGYAGIPRYKSAQDMDLQYMRNAINSLAIHLGVDLDKIEDILEVYPVPADGTKEQIINTYAGSEYFIGGWESVSTKLDKLLKRTDEIAEHLGIIYNN